LLVATLLGVQIKEMKVNSKLKFSILSVIIILFPSLNIKAQIIESFGVKGGYVSADQEWNFYYNGTIRETQSRSGFSLGGFIESTSFSSFKLILEIMYTQKGATLEERITSATNPEGYPKSFSPRIDYISIPLLLSFRIGSSNVVPYIIAGPRMDYWLSSSTEYSGHKVIYDDFNQVDLGVTIGGGLLFSRIISLEIRYCPNISRSRDNGLLFIKNNNLEFLAGYHF